MAVVAFTGASTGSVYKVGQSYSSAGRTYTAQADGSFKTTNRDGTVRSVSGSSQSETATFYHSASLASGGGGSAKSGAGKGAAAAAAVKAAAKSVPYTGNGPGALPSGSVTMPKTTQLFWDGVPLPMARGISDGGDFEQRWGEFGGGIGGLGVMAADLSSGVFKPKLYEDLSAAPGAVASGAISFAGFLDQRKQQLASEQMRKSGVYQRTYDGVPRSVGWRTGGGF